MALSEKKVLWLILALAFLVRVPSIVHGLPNLFFLDEFVHTASAFKMLAAKSPFLSFSYLPPLMSYIVAIPIGLFGSLGMVFGAWQGVVGFQEFVLFNGGYLVIFSRLVSMIFGVATVWLIYVSARKRFGRWIALFSAALLSVEYLHVLESQAGRFWSAITFMFLFALYSLWRARESGHARWFVCAALSIGLGYGFGFGTLFLIPWFLVAAFLAYRSNRSCGMIRTIAASALLVLVLFVFFSAANAYSFGRQFGRMMNTVLNPIGVHVPVEAASDQNAELALSQNVRHMLVDGFASGFPIVTILFSVGVVLFLRRGAPRSFLSDTAVFLIYFPILYLCMLPFVFNSVNIRYILPAIPPIIIIALYALAELSRYFPKRMRLAFLSFILLVLFLPRLYTIVRHDARLLRQDTRELAIDWIQTHIPSGAAIVTNIEDFDLWLIPNKEGISFKETVTPDRIRTRDTYLAGLPESPAPSYLLIDSQYAKDWKRAIVGHDPLYAVRGYLSPADEDLFLEMPLKPLALFYPASGETVAKFAEEDIFIYHFIDSRARYGPYVDIYAVN